MNNINTTPVIATPTATIGLIYPFITYPRQVLQPNTREFWVVMGNEIWKEHFKPELDDDFHVV